MMIFDNKNLLRANNVILNSQRQHRMLIINCALTYFQNLIFLAFIYCEFIIYILFKVDFFGQFTSNAID